MTGFEWSRLPPTYGQEWERTRSSVYMRNITRTYYTCEEDSVSCLFFRQEANSAKSKTWCCDIKQNSEEGGKTTRWFQLTLEEMNKWQSNFHFALLLCVTAQPFGVKFYT
jgi:hypothetical protein